MRIKGKATAVEPICASWLGMVLAGLLSLLATSAARADFYKFTFGGEIDIIQGFIPEPWDNVHIGSEYEFWYIFDSETADQNGAPILGIYDTFGGELIIDGVPQATGNGEIRVWNNSTGGYISYLPHLPIGATASIQLWDNDDLDSDELLLDIILDNWNATALEIVGDGQVSGSGFEVSGSVTSFNGQIVPGPTPLWLLALAFFGGKRRRQHIRHEVY